MLLLDIGNSAIKGQWRDNRELRLAFVCRFRAGWQGRLKTCLSQIRAERCYFSSVQDTRVEAEINGLLEGFFNASSLLRLVAKQTCSGVTNGYPEPTSLGVDRWLGLLGTAGLVQQDAIIVDVGSAITIDLLRADGQHLGGAILPGFDTSIDKFKRIMRRVDFDHAEIIHTDDPGCFTEACINIDYQTTDTSTVAEILDRWFGRLASNAALIVTGGSGSYLCKRLGRENRLVPDLVFQGMRRQLESQGDPLIKS